MAVVQARSRLLEEVADLFASNPTGDQLLQFRPSETVQQRARDLLERQNAGELSEEEQRELDQGRIAALTDTGRATEHLLRFNLSENVEMRKLLIRSDRYPQ